MFWSTMADVTQPADAGAPEVAPGVTADSPLDRAYASTMSRWLTLQTDVPRRLYHYTRIAGLEGIIRSSSFWASHVEYLNDASELLYASSLIERIIAEEGTRAERERLREALTDRPELAAPFVMGERPFVVCFCENGDLLSQWRGYGSEGPAYALGLDLHPLVTMRSLPAASVLRRVIYDREEQEKLVREAVQSWLSAVDEELQGRTDDEGIYPYPALGVLQRMLFEMHLCFKNPAFEEEQEWRLIKVVDAAEEARYASDQVRDEQMRSQMARVREQMRHAGVEHEVPELGERFSRSSWRRAEGLEVKFRPSSLGFVPYIDMPLIDRGGVFMGRLPLWEVTHGPTRHPELALQSLLLYLDAHGYGFFTEVRASAVPLRTG